MTAKNLWSYTNPGAIIRWSWVTCSRIATRLSISLEPGGSATVWLAKDEITRYLSWVYNLERNTDASLSCSCYVALKFKVAEPRGDDHEEFPTRLLDEQKRDPTVTHPGKHYILDLFDTFTSTSTNGTHLVFVTNVVRPLYGYQPTSESGWGLAAYQVTSALDYLHSN